MNYKMNTNGNKRHMNDSIQTNFLEFSDTIQKEQVTD